MTFFSAGTIPFTNWGVTNGEIEPLDDNSKQCAKTCIDPNNPICNGDWRATDCSETLKFVCTVSCKGIYLS